ncbi:MAG: hypothetical protein JWP81_1306 [Ferruginibacter sp.]|nr:hypothetical protein [Ferruginibacter sp.]
MIVIQHDKKIKILHLEDVSDDAELVKRVLKKAQMDAEIMVVDKKNDYVLALMEFSPDVILSDHSLPSFNSVEALSIFHQSGMKIPFILVTAAISEEYAVSVIKAGANDYILKDHLENLPGAITGALEKIEQEILLENKKAQLVKNKTNALLVVHETERRQMANELLENINQILATSNLYIDCAISAEDKHMGFMLNSKKCILLAIDEIKQLSQMIMPPSFEDTGFIESLNSWIHIKSQACSIKFVAEWKNVDERLISGQLQLAIYRIVQEQINNIIRYCYAKEIQVLLEQTKNRLSLTIRDDGVAPHTAKPVDGVELENINTRAEIHGGEMLVNSEPQKGCLLTISFPI